MKTSNSGVIASAWDSGIDFRNPPRPASPHKVHKARTGATDARQSVAATSIPRTRRGSPPPLDDDIDLAGSLLFMILFVLLVWL